MSLFRVQLTKRHQKPYLEMKTTIIEVIARDRIYMFKNKAKYVLKHASKKLKICSKIC